ncbi:Transposon Ty3-I Gag-Pol polyprotein [Gossypium australe]|uniref:Transposon Ty3-I Gag-Pol polyprotein n=1 Tax=Gossypium australe TaxID=47621 RepID=A0A5B6WRI8_9ROSI|nr:Transposon Ty3-I Gag-Pol polyprotein [Gossypium australe]
MTEKFLLKYFSLAKMAKLRNDIYSFVQMDLETLYDAWERYKDLLRRCPHHGLPLLLQVQTFYNGLNPSTRQLIDAATGGILNNKTPEAAYEFIEEMSLNNYQWQVMRMKPTKAAGVFNLDAVTMLSNQVELLNKNMDGLCGSSQVHPVMQCDTNGRGMGNTEYPSYNPGIESEQMNYMGNNSKLQNNPYSNTYNPSWGNHPKFSWGGQANQRQQPPPGFQPPYQQEKKPNLEEMLTKFISVSEMRFQNTETALKNQQVWIQGLETQIEQVAKLISERPQGSMPSKNLKEQLHAITARDSEGLEEPKSRQENVVYKGKVEVSHNKPKLVSKEHKPRVPYPNATKKDRIDEQLALSQMPNSVKILKELLANKQKLDDTSHVELNAVCSSILQNKLPRKLKDPGSFTIPCLIGGLSVNNALADLGVSINVMPYKMFKQLGLGKPKQTRRSIQLADKTIKFPRGIIEDVLVRIDKFIFPVDFVVLDIDEDSDVLLILGRPFLAISRTIIDVGIEELILCMAEHHAPRTMYDYAKPGLTGTESSIVRPTIAANNFELKPNIIQMVQQFVQFDGLQDEDPNTHLANFLEFCDTFNINGFSDDAIRLRLFPFSLRNKAKLWLDSLPRGSITTWDQMTKKFLLKYFPPAKIAKLRNDISSFIQRTLQCIGEIQGFVEKVSTPRITIVATGPNFLQGCEPSTRQLIDSATGGTLNNKTPEAAYKFIEEMSLNNYQWQVTRTRPAKAAGVFNIDAVTELSNQVELLHKKFDSSYGSSQAHPVMQCDASEEVVNPEYPPYGQGMESEQMNYMVILIIQVRRTTPISHGAPYPQEKKPNLEEVLTNFIATSETRFQKVETKLEALSQEFKDQFGQLAKQISERPQGRLPSNIKTNPREQVHAITAQDIVKEYTPRIPYPQAITKDDREGQFGKFLKLLKKLHINLPFLEALSQIPDSRKFLKKLLTN